MIFKVTYRFNGETWWEYYKVSSLNALLRHLVSGFVGGLHVWEVKRLLRLPKCVEPIEL